MQAFTLVFFFPPRYVFVVESNKCTRMFEKVLLSAPESSFTGTHHDNIQSFSAAVEKGCLVCISLRKCFIRQFGNLETTAGFHITYRRSKTRGRVKVRMVLGTQWFDLIRELQLARDEGLRTKFGVAERRRGILRGNMCRPSAPLPPRPLLCVSCIIT